VHTSLAPPNSRLHTQWLEPAVSDASEPFRNPRHAIAVLIASCAEPSPVGTRWDPTLTPHGTPPSPVSRLRQPLQDAPCTLPLVLDGEEGLEPGRHDGSADAWSYEPSAALDVLRRLLEPDEGAT
jgi:hypothetical protein